MDQFPYRYRLDLGSTGSSASGDEEPESPTPGEYLLPYPTQTFEVTRGDDTRRRVLGRCRVERDALGGFWVKTDFAVDLEAEGLGFFSQWATSGGRAELIVVRLWPKRVRPRLSAAED